MLTAGASEKPVHSACQTPGFLCRGRCPFILFSSWLFSHHSPKVCSHWINKYCFTFSVKITNLYLKRDCSLYKHLNLRMDQQMFNDVFTKPSLHPPCLLLVCWIENCCGKKIPNTCLFIFNHQLTIISEKDQEYDLAVTRFQWILITIACKVVIHTSKHTDDQQCNCFTKPQQNALDKRHNSLSGNRK